MDSFEPLFAFSREHCVAICSFLVPANLIATVVTLILVATGKSLSLVRWCLGIASTVAITLFLHVSTWFMIGVVTPVTFILLTLGTTCLLLNFLAVAYRREIAQWLRLIIIPPLT